MKKILFLLVIGFLASAVHAKESAVNTTISQVKQEIEKQEIDKLNKNG